MHTYKGGFDNFLWALVQFCHLHIYVGNKRKYFFIKYNTYLIKICAVRSSVDIVQRQEAGRRASSVLICGDRSQQ